VSKPRKDENMSKLRIEGATQKAVGAVMQTIGKAVGDERLQAEGIADKVVGSAKEVVGKAADGIRKPTR
jgi:uncharacterized protein YjbJ (UPF0337 family)